MSGLRQLFDPGVREARRRAVQYLEDRHPTWTVTGARLRAAEPSRHVFAVFYDDPAVRVIPGRYVLVAVERTGERVEPLETSPDSPYWIRGRK